jgi:uncharacterized protein YcaQ
MAVRLSVDRARAFMLGHHGLRRDLPEAGAAGLERLLRERRCIQLDPLDRIGTNADLVALARVAGVRRGDLHLHLRGRAFEHFAKERCLLPAEAFPYYRHQAAETPWWRLSEREARLPAALTEAVRAEIAARGPVTAEALTDRGRVEAIDWSGWKGTSKASTMALEVLWTRCQVVVCGRTATGGRLYDVPERALPAHATTVPDEPFARWALRERVEAAGLLPRTAGPWWSMLSSVRTGPVPDALVAEGVLEEVEIEGARTRYLAPAGVAERSDRHAHDDDDGRMRFLGPLDPMLWYRPLVSQVFGFDYVWEVYKPAEKRAYGWYVCPILHEGALVGRFEGHFDATAGEIVVTGLWPESGRRFDRRAFRRALKRHAAAM